MAQSPKNHAKVRYDVVLEKCINFPLLFKADLPLEAVLCRLPRAEGRHFRSVE